MKKNTLVTAFAPASIGNVGVGFDMLGLAIAGAGDKVSARQVDKAGVTIKEVRGLDGEIHAELSSRADENTASIAAQALLDEAGIEMGVELVVYKGVPLQSGMGSSAASAVAAVVAVNQLLDRPLPTERLLAPALQGEKFASGGLHADNVAPSLVGGLVLCPQVLLPQMISVTPPKHVSSVLIHPELQVNTAESRGKLLTEYSIEQWLTQQGYLAGFIAACEQNDVELFAQCLRDTVIEPQRAASVPCFAAVKAAAMRSKAYGCSLSGSGPSIFAICADADAAALADAMSKACSEAGFECQAWVSNMDAPGATFETST